MRLPIPGIGHEKLQPGFHFIVSRLTARLGSDGGPRPARVSCKDASRETGDQASSAPHQARVAVGKLRRQQEVRHPGSRSRPSTRWTSRFKFRIIRPIPHKNQRPLVIEAGDKSRRTGGNRSLPESRRGTGRARPARRHDRKSAAESDRGHVPMSWRWQQNAVRLVTSASSASAVAQSASNVVVISPRQGAWATVLMASGTRMPFAIRIRQNVAQRAFVNSFTHESQGGGQATLSAEDRKRGPCPGRQ